MKRITMLFIIFPLIFAISSCVKEIDLCEPPPPLFLDVEDDSDYKQDYIDLIKSHPNHFYNGADVNEFYHITQKIDGYKLYRISTNTSFFKYYYVPVEMIVEIPPASDYAHNIPYEYSILINIQRSAPKEPMKSWIESANDNQILTYMPDDNSVYNSSSEGKGIRKQLGSTVIHVSVPNKCFDDDFPVEFESYYEFVRNICFGIMETSELVSIE